MDVHGYLMENEMTITPVRENDEEVIYLYSTSTRERVVELIDMTENGEESLNVAFTATTDSPTITRIIPVQQSSRVDAQPAYKNVSKPVSSPVKKPQKKRKRLPDVPRCIMCEENYDVVANKKGGLHSNKCGHLYCLPCIKSLKDGTCIQCNRAISNLLKIYV